MKRVQGEKEAIYKELDMPGKTIIYYSVCSFYDFELLFKQSL